MVQLGVQSALRYQLLNGAAASPSSALSTSAPSFRTRAAPGGMSSVAAATSADSGSLGVRSSSPLPTGHTTLLRHDLTSHRPLSAASPAAVSAAAGTGARSRVGSGLDSRTGVMSGSGMLLDDGRSVCATHGSASGASRASHGSNGSSGRDAATPVNTGGVRGGLIAARTTPASPPRPVRRPPSAASAAPMTAWAPPSQSSATKTPRGGSQHVSSLISGVLADNAARRRSSLARAKQQPRASHSTAAAAATGGTGRSSPVSPVTRPAAPAAAPRTPRTAAEYRHGMSTYDSIRHDLMAGQRLGISNSTSSAAYNTAVSSAPPTPPSAPPTPPQSQKLPQPPAGARPAWIGATAMPRRPQRPPAAPMAAASLPEEAPAVAVTATRRVSSARPAKASDELFSPQGPGAPFSYPASPLAAVASEGGAGNSAGGGRAAGRSSAVHRGHASIMATADADAGYNVSAGTTPSGKPLTAVQAYLREAELPPSRRRSTFSPYAASAATLGAGGTGANGGVLPLPRRRSSAASYRAPSRRRSSAAAAGATAGGGSAGSWATAGSGTAAPAMMSIAEAAAIVAQEQEEKEEEAAREAAAAAAAKEAAIAAAASAAIRGQRPSSIAPPTPPRGGWGQQQVPLPIGDGAQGEGAKAGDDGIQDVDEEVEEEEEEEEREQYSGGAPTFLASLMQLRDAAGSPAADARGSRSGSAASGRAAASAASAATSRATGMGSISSERGHQRHGGGGVAAVLGKILSRDSIVASNRILSGQAHLRTRQAAQSSLDAILAAEAASSASAAASNGATTAAVREVRKLHDEASAWHQDDTSCGPAATGAEGSGNGGGGVGAKKRRAPGPGGMDHYRLRAAARMDARDLGAAKWSSHTAKAAALGPPSAASRNSGARRRLILFGGASEHGHHHGGSGGAGAGESFLLTTAADARGAGGGSGKAGGAGGGSGGGGGGGAGGTRRVLTVAEQQAQRPQAIIYQECVYPVAARA